MRMNSRSMVVVALFALVVFIVVPVILASTFTAIRATQLRQEREVVRFEPPPEAAPAPPPAEPEPEVMPELRPVDEAAMAVMETPMDAPVLADATPGQPFRIQLERGPNGVSASKLHIDLDRDGKFDEVWTLGSPMRRDVSPNDDGALTEHTAWTDRGWSPAAP
jgi:hypothetical protein